MKYYININAVPASPNEKILDDISRSFRRSLSEENEITHNGSWFEYETRLLNCVEQGDIEGAMSLMESQLTNKKIPPRLGYNVHDDLLQARYALVSMMTLLARSAIRSGFGENESLTLSDMYIQKSAEINDSNEIISLIATAIMEYTRIINDLKSAPKYSSAVVFCCNYITEHVHANIPLRELADSCHLSKEYLSRLFKKETGYTVKEYYLMKKMEIAASLLAYSERSIQDIAFYLGFSSHSRFSEYFKLHFGLSPSEYRKSK